MKVTCINDSKLPQGANVVKDTVYTVVEEFANSMGQNVYIIEGITNKGTTKIGFPWIGYDATRFAKVIKDTVQSTEVEYALN